MFDKIVVAYWVPSKTIEETMGIPHNTVYEEYSIEKQREISEKVLEKGLQVMMKQGLDRHLIIYIDNGSFRQR